MRPLRPLLTSLVVFLAACGMQPERLHDGGMMDPHAGHGGGGGGTGGGGGGGGGSGSDGGNHDAGTGASDAGSDGGTVSAPDLLSVTAGGHTGMSLVWQNPAAGCSSIQVRMKPPSGSYATVKTVAGTATTTTYDPGHTAGTYCFTLVCVLNGASSAPSNERCATQ